MDPLAGPGKHRDGHVGRGPDRPEPVQRNAGLLHEGLDQPDGEERSEAQNRRQQQGRANGAVVDQRHAQRIERFAEMAVGLNLFVARDLLERAAQPIGSEPHADLDDERQQRPGGVEHAGEQRPGSLTRLSEAVHPPVVAGVVHLLAAGAQRLVEQGAVRAADEGEGGAEKDFRQKNVEEGIGRQIEAPADQPEDCRDIEG